MQRLIWYFPPEYTVYIAEAVQYKNMAPIHHWLPITQAAL